MARLDRFTEYLLGDCAGGGVHEPGVDYGPGYGDSYAQDGITLILLLRGGTKRTQDKDIEKAHA